MTTHNNLRAVGVCEAVCAVTLKRFRASIARNEELFTCRSTPLCFLLNESGTRFQRGGEPPEGLRGADAGATLTPFGNFSPFFPGEFADSVAASRLVLAFVLEKLLTSLPLK